MTVPAAAGAQAADHGLFGSGSLTWRIMGEPVIWVAGLRPLYLHAPPVVGLDPATVPASVAELDAYYEAVRPGIHACAEAKQALRKSYHPDVPAQFLALKLMLPPLNTLAFASLPRWARRMYRTPGSPLTDVGATAALRMAHQSTTRIPRQLLYLPAARAAHRGQRERERRAAA